MKEFRAIIKNYDKFNDIKLAKGLMLSLKQKKERDGKIGKSTEDFGTYWFKSVKGDVIFKNIKALKFKDISKMQSFNEILCYNLAKRMGINCAEYSSATLDNQVEGIASVNFLKDGEKILPLCDVTSCEKNLDSIMINLRQKDFLYGSINYEQIYYSLYSYMIFDLLTYQEDRHMNNISLIQDKDYCLKIAPLYDNEYSFFVSTFMFGNSNDFESAEEYVDNYFISGGMITPYQLDKCYGLEGFDFVANQIIDMAKNDKKCDFLLRKLIKNADIDAVYADLQNQGYKIDESYEEFTKQIFNYSRNRLYNLYTKNKLTTQDKTNENEAVK